MVTDLSKQVVLALKNNATGFELAKLDGIH
jgi:hypothetical protein